ncbi:golgin subfamily B member 1-like [Mus pahari]|uniref:golgin subfamily B member 1-like n=1 Tax=Mus pahari TaxID=10093 RepID=UPI001114ECC0|nr:golgin subfamily B member 1-like [Mus pahari]XP_029390556.1 golgin subfamily B member 1-like [Mus pahari]
MMKEELRQEKLSWQHELHQFRMEKNSWELHERRMKEQYLMAITDKDQQLGHLQSLLRELRSPSQTQMLPTQYQQQFSQLLEEKNVLSTLLSDTSQSLRENQHHCSNLFNHCAILEKGVQKLQAGPLNAGVAQGAPQEKKENYRKSEPETTGEEQPR